jgi:hypothetical protein
MAGRRTKSTTETPRGNLLASLREDYLNQVQRDFLSRPVRALRQEQVNTPSEAARKCAQRVQIISETERVA